MTVPKPRILILALGNDILGDDGIGLAAGRLLGPEMDDIATYLEAPGAGYGLLELFEGYEYALLIDAIVTGTVAPGTILELTQDDFRHQVGPSPHYVGLPEVLMMADTLHLPLPKEIRILAVEIADPYSFAETLSAVGEAALPKLVARAKEVISKWREKYEV
jgi:hydrogenase maturation protease